MNIKKLIPFIAALLTITLTVILFYWTMNYMMSNYPMESKFIEVKKFETVQEDYIEISTKELKEYPNFERILSGEGCRKFNDNNWNCDVSDEEYNKLLNFVQINKKARVDSFFKIGKNYYRFGFGSP